jgi:homoserine O-acetyltransferase
MTMKNEPQYYTHAEPFDLECGIRLPQLRIAYHTFGTLNAARSNAVWVCHALTANSDVSDWWSGLFGEGRALDPSRDFVVCANIIGSHYGTTGPLDLNPDTGLIWGPDFPLITVRDMVNAHILLRRHLGIDSIRTVMGGSLGGQQALEWAIAEPDVIQRVVAIATNARHSAWGIAFNEAQRMAIMADGTYGERHADAARQGLMAARAVAMLSYRHYDTYRLTQTDAESLTHGHRASSYQRYQGEKLANRFNAYSYVSLSRTMDSHDVGRGRGGTDAALGQIQADALVLGIRSDVLFPVAEQRYLGDAIANARYVEVESVHGHDGFLTETDVLNGIFCRFMHDTRSPEALTQPVWPAEPD